ncbi:hypothetical protein D9M71_184300 [compost metagenome]
MQHEVDVQLIGHQVDAPWRVLAHGRPCATIPSQISGLDRLLLRWRFGKQQLDMVVTAHAGEALQLGTAEGDAAHARGQVGDPQHLQAALADLVVDAVNGVTHGMSP